MPGFFATLGLNLVGGVFSAIFGGLRKPPNP